MKSNNLSHIFFGPICVQTSTGIRKSFLFQKKIDRIKRFNSYLESIPSRGAISEISEALIIPVRSSRCSLRETTTDSRVWRGQSRVTWGEKFKEGSVALFVSCADFCGKMILVCHKHQDWQLRTWTNTSSLTFPSGNSLCILKMFS